MRKSCKQFSLNIYIYINRLGYSSFGLLNQTIFTDRKLWPRHRVPLAPSPGKLAVCLSCLHRIKSAFQRGEEGEIGGACWKRGCKTLWWCANQNQPEKKDLWSVSHVHTSARTHASTHTNSTLLCQDPEPCLGKSCMSYCTLANWNKYIVLSDCDIEQTLQISR